ncbi:3-oxo-5-alpha-steroid 4-dehydrogenase 1-like [Panicum miliaceum]|uniref:3-oxo-5-alpha-steroid 4-dehydrogenase 1-like n=1 Tax=Panicum miliaceum TaxID=4540 RepID=A0A3L6TEP3_PANMI|nr:3-oxo-5-alpha-steroid 4-dehydrogenase 1-like [Panicum miliaceum]
MWPPFLYAPSPLVAALTGACVPALAVLALPEFRGGNLAYSKFVRASGAGALLPLLPSRAGMLVSYAPALAAALASFAVPGAVEGPRARLLCAAVAAHLLKRVLEVLLVHRYSGSMPLATALLISSCHLFNAVAMIYVQRLSRGLPEPAVDLLFPGVLAFAVGAAGNFYHHLLLSRLRAGGGGGDKGYRIPRGGLFGLVACPHYLFEIVAFFGFAMIAQTVYALVVAVGSAAYLAGRSSATRKWYASKFEEFPATVKALVPYVW